MNESRGRGRTPVEYLTVTARGAVLIGAAVYEQAGSPAYLRPEWGSGSMVFWVSDAPEKRRQGISKVVLNNTSYSISMGPIIDEAGLVVGRYAPTSVNHQRIVMPLTPFWTPDQVWDPEAVVDHTQPTTGVYTVEQAAEILAIAPQKLAKDIQEGIIKPQPLNPGGQRLLYILSDRDLYLYRRWQWQTFRIGSDPDAHK